MRRALDETNRRREIQRKYNEEHGITPQSVKRAITDLHMSVYEADYLTVPIAADGAEYQPDQIPKIVEELEREMKKAAQSLEFEKAAQLRDRIVAMKDLQLGLPRNTIGVKGSLGSGAMLAAASMGRGGGGRRGEPQPTRRRRR